MSDFDTAAKMVRHIAGMEAILEAARFLRKHGHRDASELILINVGELVEAKPQQTLPKTWPFPTNAERALL